MLLILILKKIIDLIHDLKSENKTIIFVSHRKSTLEKCDLYLSFK